MRIRVKFAKFGCARFLGHLDVMRYFQKAFRRAGLPAAFSEGYHPHPLLSFAQPLSLSYTSDGEYFDLELTEVVPTDVLFRSLQEVMCEEIRIMRVTVLPDYRPNEKKITGMALITGAMYAISLNNFPEGLRSVLSDFSEKPVFMIEKKTKTGTRPCDLRSGVHGIMLYQNGDFDEIYSDGIFTYPTEEMAEGLCHADLYEGGAIIVCLDAGSERNIPADLFLSGILSMCEDSVKPEVRIHRMDLFGDKGVRKVPLWKIES